MNLDLNSHVHGKLCPEVAPSPANDLAQSYFETSPMGTMPYAALYEITPELRRCISKFTASHLQILYLEMISAPW